MRLHVRLLLRLRIASADYESACASASTSASLLSTAMLEFHWQVAVMLLRWSKTKRTASSTDEERKPLAMPVQMDVLVAMLMAVKADPRLHYDVAFADIGDDSADANATV